VVRYRPVRRLIVNADDFGRSHSINEAVVGGHRHGILRSASLMVNGPAFDEAVEMARQNPDLGVGLHLALVCSRSTLPPKEIPGLVKDRSEFSTRPVASGIKYFVRPSMAPQLQAEIAAQLAKFHDTGLQLDHVNGHLNLHLHPTIFRLLIGNAERFGMRALRLTCDPFWLNARLARGRWFYRATHAVIYRLLSGRARPRLRQLGIRHTDRVFGLLQNAHVTEQFTLKLLPNLPAGDSELYSHPSLDEFKHEYDALISPRVRRLIEDEKIELIRYQDL